MPTGSYDSSVVTSLITATQPLNLVYWPANITIPAVQPFVFYVDNYLATYTASTQVVDSTFSTVVVGVDNYPVVRISAMDTFSNIIIIS